MLVGASRKSFLGRLLAGPDGAPRPVGDREDATAAVTTLSALRGAWGVRVHDVQRNVDAALVAAAIRDSGFPRNSPARPIETGHCGGRVDG